jgi:ThiF family/Prokaryotic homologs of the JAB domain
MKRQGTLVLPHKIAAELQRHLFPGDGLEAAALLLCATTGGYRTKLLGRELVLVPHDQCSRERDRIVWPGQFVEAAIDRAEANGYVVIAVHSHPGGIYGFSYVDNESDKILMGSLRHGTGRMAGSAIMVPGGAMRARLYEGDSAPVPVELVMSIGSDISLFWADMKSPAPALAFSSGMRATLARMSACIVGVSGTGSVVAEQLARLGFGEIILIDFDKLEAKNLNRILNSSVDDIGACKVAMFAKAVGRYRTDCRVVQVPLSIATREAILAAAEADILFSCVDTAEGRHIADRLAAYFAMPLFDVGVAIPSAPNRDGTRRIAEVYGRVDYVFPGGSSLLDRGVYDAATLEAEYLAANAPATLARKVADGYLQGVGEEAPAVISLNMRAASACVLEFIARVFPFRQYTNEHRARTIFMLGEGEEDAYAEGNFEASNRFPVGVGPTEPLLGIPALTLRRRVA